MGERSALTLFIFTTLLLAMLQIAEARTSFIEERIILQPTGDAIISGTTNLDFLSDLHPANTSISGTTTDLTEKKGKYWTFTYDPKTSVNASILKVSLPKGSVINYIKSSLPVSISTSSDIITLSFAGEGRPSILIQYSIQSFHVNSVFYAYLLGATTCVLAIALFLKQSVKPSRLGSIRSTLNETQLKIIDALLEKKGEASQTTLSYLTHIPKASLSRNIELLAQKEIVQKFFNGTSNHVKLHPKMK